MKVRKGGYRTWWNVGSTDEEEEREEERHKMLWNDDETGRAE